MALIIVHGMGIRPDCGMVNTLRQRLNDYGHTTLSIQMPALAKTASYREYPATFPEAVERLKITITYQKQHGYKKIAIVSLSDGSHMSRVYMATNPVGVSAWAAPSLTPGDTFKGIKAPIQDLYGKNDLEHVISSAGNR